MKERLLARKARDSAKRFKIRRIQFLVRDLDGKLLLEKMNEVEYAERIQDAGFEPFVVLVDVFLARKRKSPLHKLSNAFLNGLRVCHFVSDRLVVPLAMHQIPFRRSKSAES